MEPDGLEELLTKRFTDVLQQNYYSRHPQVIQEFAKAIAAVGRVTDDKDDLASLYGASFYMSEYIKNNSYVLNTHIKDIEDKDLGLVRKINLN